MDLRKLLGIKSKEEGEELKRKETAGEEKTEIVELKTRALIAFKQNIEGKKARARRYFRQDFGTDPDEVVYLGDCKFLFKANGLSFRAYIEWFGDYVYGKSYRLAVPCCKPECECLVIGERHFNDLAGLGEAIQQLQASKVCDVCEEAGRVDVF